ncbi:hypothetical protein HOC35_03260 [Candidatus Woesearchaeota archaeon]|jgi:hypothetical protein|nr:hypothetical protein [Candidatus Woesearchaeota archaeon]
MVNIFKKGNNYFKSTIFFNSLKLFFSKPQKILFFIITDLILIACLLILNGLIGLLFNTLKVTSIALVLFITLFNLIAIIILYSVARKKILEILFSYKDKKAFEWKHLKEFTGINFLIYLTTLIISLLIAGIILFTIKEDYSKKTLGLIIGIIVVFVYTFLNFAHINFAKNRKFKHALDYAWKALSEYQSYKPLISSAVIFFIYLVIMSTISVIVTLIVFKLSLNTTILQIYTATITIIGGAILYFCHLFNKVYYLNLIELKS